MSSQVTPPHVLQREIFGRLLIGWGELALEKRVARGRLTGLLDAFAPNTPRLLKAVKSEKDVDLAEQSIWQVGPAITKGSPVLFPVATAAVWVDKGALNGCVRVLLVAARPGASPQSWGWRFDSAEQPAKPAEAAGSKHEVPRPHAHAQPITSWYQNGARCLLHPHTPGEAGDGCPYDPESSTPPLNETHPAFPLRGDTLPGLAMAFIVAMHGSPAARKVLDANPTIEKTAGSVIRADLATVLGARHP